MNETDTSNLPVCLITGGSSGIGLAIALKFSSHGYRIAFCGRREAVLVSAAEQLRQTIPAALVSAGSTQDHSVVLAELIDLEEAEQAKKFARHVIERFGRVDVLVNNAATAILSPFESITEEEFESTLDLNLRGWFYLTQVIWKFWLSQTRSGELPVQKRNLINISSLAAVDPFPQFSIYGASKAWMDLMTHALAGEGKPHDIRVGSIRPGAVETPLLRKLFPDFPADQCVRPEKVAEMVWNVVHRPDEFPSGGAFGVS